MEIDLLFLHPSKQLHSLALLRRWQFLSHSQQHDFLKENVLYFFLVSFIIIFHDTGLGDKQVA